MRIIIHTARRYTDLPNVLMQKGLIENNRSAVEVCEVLDKMINEQIDIEIVTLHESPINRVGQWIALCGLDHKIAQVILHFEDGSTDTVIYDEVGMLRLNFPVGFLSPNEIQC